jgi:hypothetical protein
MTKNFFFNCMVLCLTSLAGITSPSVAQQIQAKSSTLPPGNEDYIVNVQLKRDKEIAAINSIRKSSLNAIGKESFAQANAIHLDAERKIKEVQTKYDELIKASSIQNDKDNRSTVSPTVKTYTNFAESSPIRPVQKEREIAAKAMLLHVQKSHGKSK